MREQFSTSPWNHVSCVLLHSGCCVSCTLPCVCVCPRSALLLIHTSFHPFLRLFFFLLVLHFSPSFLDAPTPRSLLGGVRLQERSFWRLWFGSGRFLCRFTSNRDKVPGQRLFLVPIRLCVCVCVCTKVWRDVCSSVCQVTEQKKPWRC